MNFEIGDYVIVTNADILGSNLIKDGDEFIIIDISNELLHIENERLEMNIFKDKFHLAFELMKTQEMDEQILDELCELIPSLEYTYINKVNGDTGIVLYLGDKQFEFNNIFHAFKSVELCIFGMHYEE